ncbi:hypothetical protein [Bradyrhizobium yuanmingense]|uniref:hypothetical protein n=1 Tax=Bradyrhizobium yuanmingense TaxID=108015 RepID=UPI003514D6D9
MKQGHLRQLQFEAADLLHAKGVVGIVAADTIAIVRIVATEAEAAPDVGLDGQTAAQFSFGASRAAERRLVERTIVPELALGDMHS